MNGYVVYNENGVAFTIAIDGSGGLPVIDENANVFSLVLTVV